MKHRFQKSHSYSRRIIDYLTISTLFVASLFFPGMSITDDGTELRHARAAKAADVSSPFHYHFRVPGILNETGSMHESSSPYFWLNSGGQLILKDGRGYTVQGMLPAGSLWQTLYGASNSLDTEGGLLPQNLFRLVTRSEWHNVSATLRFNIQDIHTTNTPNRDGYSGILLMSRYQNGDNLYYAGLRMDGAAVIKKKKNGTYFTLAQEQVFGNSALYDKFSNPNLIPEETWLGLRMDTKNISDGSTRITLFVDENDDGSWRKLLEFIDTEGGADGAPVSGSGYMGIRTDYLDAVFDDYTLKNI